MQLVRYNHFFALLISMPRINVALIFIKIGIKINYFCQKNKKFRAQGAPPPHPMPTVAESLAPRPPMQLPPAVWGSSPRPP